MYRSWFLCDIKAVLLIIKYSFISVCNEMVISAMLNGSNAGAAVYCQLSLEITQKQGMLPSPTKSSVDVDFLRVPWELPAVHG